MPLLRERIRERLGKRLKRIGNRILGEDSPSVPEPIKNYKKSMADLLNKSEEEIERSEPFKNYRDRFS